MVYAARPARVTERAADRRTFLEMSKLQIPLLALLGVFGCRHPAHVRELKISDSAHYWREQGFVEMVPPLRLPTRGPDGNRVSVWLKLPPGSVIHSRWSTSTDRQTISLPPGTDAVRVEEIRLATEEGVAWSVADARGTRFDRGGKERFYVLRAEASQPNAPLVGYEWQRGDASAESEAASLVSELVAKGVAPKRRAEVVARTRLNNQCARCHSYGRPDNQRPNQYGEVNRGTDLSGLFQVESLLRPRVPLEQYFPFETNANDRYLDFRCASGTLHRVNQPVPNISCSDGSVPMGSLDVRAALAAGDDRVKALCAARRYLYEHLDSPARTAFSERFAECGLPITPG